MTTVLISAPYMIPFLDRFQPVLEGFGLNLIVPEVTERLEEDQLLRYAGKFDGIICGDDRFTRVVLEACTPRLKVISKWGTGIDSIDQAACADLGVFLGNTPNAFTEPVADSVLGYILTFARKQPWMDQAMKRGRWEKISGRALNECTLGVIGVGNIGKAVIKRARSFEMQVLGNDIQDIPPEFVKKFDLQMVNLDELLKNADFISINCTLNPTSEKLINKEAFSIMKPEAFLINTARGPIVDESALIEALNSKIISGAALDVFEVEPLAPESPLRDFNNVLLAPHNSNSSPKAWEKVHWNTIKNLLDGLGISYQVNERGEIR
jgi:D-3-phosphoglycerate dehydrogenase